MSFSIDKDGMVIDIAVPVPDIPAVALPGALAIPSINLPGIPSALTRVTDLAEDVVSLATKLVDLIPDYAVTVKLTVGGTTLVDQTISLPV